MQTPARTPWLALIGLVLAVAGSALAYTRWPAVGEPASAGVETANRIVAAQEPAVEAARAGGSAPSFDIVRVTPQGGAVIAGRAEPGARVVVRDGDRVVGEAQADGSGAFLLPPGRMVEPGGRELTLTARDADGRETAGAASVFVLVQPPQRTASADPAAPKPGAGNDAALAVLLPRDDAPSRVLQAPRKLGGVALNAVDYNDQGAIRFSGSAQPDAPVRVYVDNTPVGETHAGSDGRWTMTPSASLEAGLHRLRVDELGAGGVRSRVELPFQRTIAVSGLSPGQTVVQPGNNLWRIARQTYGSGARYVVIYMANREQIRDPSRIYPGQVFAVPAAK